MKEPQPPALIEVVEALRSVHYDHPLVRQWDEWAARARFLRTVCRVCKHNPRAPGFDNCGAPDCIPF